MRERKRLEEVLATESELARRSDITAKAVGSMTATRLKDFVYQAIPEITDMKWGDEIAL